MEGLLLSINGTYDFPKKGVEEVIFQLQKKYVGRELPVEVIWTDGFNNINKFNFEDHPLASAWWDSVLDWWFESAKKIDELSRTIGRENREYKTAVGVHRNQERLIREYLCTVWNLCCKDWVMEWDHYKNICFKTRFN